MTTRVLVIGAGPAGTRCAVRAAARLPGAAVTLAGAEPGPPTTASPCPSTWRATWSTTRWSRTPPLEALAAAGVAYRANTRVEMLDLASRRALTAEGDALDYDWCVLATGSRAVRLPLPGADLPGVVPWRDLAGSRAMLDAAAGGGSAVVIGGGLLGLEAAVGLAIRGMQVTVLHAVGWPMERQLDAEAGALLTERLRGRGLAMLMNAKTAAIEGTDRVEAVRLVDGTRIPCRLVVKAVGVRPNTDLARASGLTVGRGVVVDASMRTSDPRVLAIGECAEVEGRVVGLVAPALEHAEVAAATVAGEAASWAARADSAALKVSGAAVWSAGEVAPQDANAVTLRVGETYRGLWWRGERLVGAVLYGDVAESAFYLGLISSGEAVASRADAALGSAWLEDVKDAA